MAGIAGGRERLGESFPDAIAAGLGDALLAGQGQSLETLHPASSAALVSVPLTGGRAGGAVTDEHSGCAMVVSGEAFDDRRLSPAELLERYLEEGKVFLRGLDGRFALALHDPRSDVLVVASDTWGTLPVYFVEGPQRVLFSTSLEALLADPSWSREIDRHAVLEMLSFGCLQGNRTLLSQVRVLDAGTILIVGADGHHKEAYRKLVNLFPPPEDAPEDDVLEDIRIAFNAAVARRGEQMHVPLLLSGGLDSRAILSASLASGIEARTYTYGEDDSLDVELSREVAATAGCPWRHLVTPRETCYSPENLRKATRITGASLSAIHSIGVGIIPQLAAAEHALLLGNGAEFVRGGIYDGLGEVPPRFRDLTELARILTQRFNVGFPLAGRHDILRDEVYANCRNLPEEGTRAALSRLEGLSSEDILPAYFLEERTRRYLNGGGPIFFGTMIACRFPFYDADYLRACARLGRRHWAPGSMIHRYIVRRNSEELARVPLTFALSICSGRHSPGSRWLKKTTKFLRRALHMPCERRVGCVDSVRAFLHQRGPVEAWLRSSVAVELGLFDRDKIAALLAETWGARGRLSRKLAAALTVELFIREFVTEQPELAATAEGELPAGPMLAGRAS